MVGAARQVQKNLLSRLDNGDSSGEASILRHLQMSQIRQWINLVQEDLQLHLGILMGRRCLLTKPHRRSMAALSDISSLKVYSHIFQICLRLVDAFALNFDIDPMTRTLGTWAPWAGTHTLPSPGRSQALSAPEQFRSGAQS